MKQKKNRQEADARPTYMTPQVKVVSLGHGPLLQQFSGGHNDAGNDASPLHARRIDSFGWEDEEDDGESSYGKKLDW